MGITSGGDHIWGSHSGLSWGVAPRDTQWGSPSAGSRLGVPRAASSAGAGGLADTTVWGQQQEGVTLTPSPEAGVGDMSTLGDLSPGLTGAVRCQQGSRRWCHFAALRGPGTVRETHLCPFSQGPPQPVPAGSWMSCGCPGASRSRFGAIGRSSSSPGRVQHPRDAQCCGAAGAEAQVFSSQRSCAREKLQNHQCSAQTAFTVLNQAG